MVNNPLTRAVFLRGGAIGGVCNPQFAIDKFEVLPLGTNWRSVQVDCGAAGGILGGSSHDV